MALGGNLTKDNQQELAEFYLMEEVIAAKTE